ncbi:putative oxidation resistance protein 1 [Dipodascopsis tothii]|uniref:putative oxidation resistance protein 1 n=1 Tax=Dipodascopsis tothii TaxID=44089 RepID=UPI0034CD0C94
MSYNDSHDGHDGHVSLTESIRNTIRRFSVDVGGHGGGAENNDGQNEHNERRGHHHFHDVGFDYEYDDDDDMSDHEHSSFLGRDENRQRGLLARGGVSLRSKSPAATGTSTASATAPRPTAAPAPAPATSFLFAPPPLTPLTLTGYAERTGVRLLSPALAEEIRQLLPSRLQLYDKWTLVYSLEQHGVSLTTLYNRAVPPRTAGRPGYVLIVEDSAGGIFGAYMNEYPRPTKHARYYGNGECFLWKSRLIKTPEMSTESLSTPAPPQIQFKTFPYTGINDYMILCEPKFLSVGGGDGKYGLYLDDRFEKGISDTCPAFGNEPLSDMGVKFDIVGLELWRVSAV